MRLKGFTTPITVNRCINGIVFIPRISAHIRTLASAGVRICWYMSLSRTSSKPAKNCGSLSSPFLNTMLSGRYLQQFGCCSDTEEAEEVTGQTTFNHVPLVECIMTGEVFTGTRLWMETNDSVQYSYPTDGFAA